MTTTVLNNVRKELVNVLRNSDIITTAIRGVTTATDTFTATASQTAFTLSQTGIHNVRSVTVQSVTKKYITEYTFTTAGVVTLATGATVGNTVVIVYDYGSSGDKIFPDWPRDDIKLFSFPRVSIGIISETTMPFQLGGGKHISEITFSITAWMPVKKDAAVAGGLGGNDDLYTLVYNIRDAIRTNEKLLSTISFITPTSIGPIIAGTNNAVIQVNHDFVGKFVIE